MWLFLVDGQMNALCVFLHRSGIILWLKNDKNHVLTKDSISKVSNKISDYDNGKSRRKRFLSDSHIFDRYDIVKLLFGLFFDDWAIGKNACGGTFFMIWNRFAAFSILPESSLRVP